MKKLLLLIIPFLLLTGCSAGSLTSNDPFYLYDLYVEGNLTLTDTCYDDLRFPVNVLRLSDIRPPVWSNVITPGYTLAFEDKAIAAQEEEITFIVQMPHNWKEGTSVYFHLHYAYPVAQLNTRSYWSLQYDWQNTGESFGLGTHTTYAYTSYTDNTALKNQYSLFPAISGAGHDISSIIICSLMRHSSDVSDNYTENVNLLEIDVHYEIDSFGSKTQTAK